MVTARLAIGSVSTLALGALLFGSAPYWLHRGATQAAPWGAIASPAPASSDAPASADDRAQLLRLAALKSGAAPDTTAVAAPTPAPEPAPVPRPVATADAAPAEAALAATPPAQAAEPMPVQVATAEDPAAVPPEASDAAAAKSTLININTASASALDHLPGAGRIGHTIVSHRPYKSVKDLVNKRVLRMSDFQKIQSKVSVD